MAIYRDKNQRQNDMKEIARLALFGNLSQGEIAERIGIDQPAVSRILKKLRKQWAEEAKADIGEVIALELKKLDAMELETLAEWEKSKKDYQKRSIEDKPKSQNGGGRTAKVETGGQCGDPRYMTVLLQIQDRRAKFLGTDKPSKVAPTTPDGEKPYQNRTDAELDARLSELMVKAANAAQ